MKRIVLILVLLFSLILLLIPSCSKKSKPPLGPDNSKTDTIISQQAVIVDQQKNLTTQSITDNTITYSYTGKAPSIKTGDVLVSGEGYGYLRKVTNVSTFGNQISVSTEGAVLTDVIQKGKIDTTITLDYGAQKIGGAMKVVRTADGVSVTERQINLKGISLSGKSGNADFTITITNGIIEFKPDLKIDCNINDFKVNEFHAIIDGDIIFNFDVSASLSTPINSIGSTKISFENEVFVAEFQYILLQWIGPVPVIEVIETEILAGVRAEASATVSVTTGFERTTNVRVGAQYLNGDWSPVWAKKPPVFKAHPTEWPVKAGYEVVTYVRPKVSVKFYNAAGPYIDATPYLGFFGEIGGEYAWSWKLSCGLEASIGFDMSKVGFGDNGLKIVDFNIPLLEDAEILIASNHQEWPKTYTISGKILENTSGLSGVTIRLTGAGKDTTATTTSTGSYTFTGLPNGTYTLTPSKTDYTFTSPNPQATVSSANYTVPDIAATKTKTTPAAPTTLAATTASSSLIILTWKDNSTDEQGFRIERKQGTGTWGEIGTVGANVTAYSAAGLSADTEYTFRVRAYNTGGNSGYSNEATARTQIQTPTILSAPSDLTASASSSSQINLSWADNSSNEQGFRIERKQGTGSYSEIGTVGANVTAYSSTGLSADTDYTFRVRAYNSAGNSGYSNEATTRTQSGIIPPSSPSNLTASAVSSSRIDLIWKDNSNNEQGFRIERKQGSGSYTEIGTVSANVTSYSAMGLTADTEYTFRVRAYNSAGNSGYLNEATARTQTGGGTTVKIVSIPGGTFQMGDVEGNGYYNEKPVHTVTVSGFEMGVYEITNAQYAKYLNEALASGYVTATSSSVKGAKGVYSGQEYIYLSGNWSDYPDARCWITYSNNNFTMVAGHENWPVVWVTWYGSKAFALYYGLDLPTEAEWEYACRGGKQYKYGTDDGTLSTSKANYWDNGVRHPVNVGSYPANPFGLYDMSGNVSEWCHDWYGTYPSGSVTNPTGALSGSSRVQRGGCWFGAGYSSGYGCQSVNRIYSNPGIRTTYVGFRIVRRASLQNY